ncbi:E3 ubiquitin-protein ligase [Vitis vinifera]|uniref:E3 ubiquitin-protein ligase n=1 Tax=Vitis vinifera TaxID=29760 RepID=A0A438GZG9_VITVI|nr:E3 ubiquitin-protein ligase [Vitis vinifera]
MQMANQNDGEHIIEIGDQRPSIPTIQTPSSSPSHSNPFESGLWISLQFILSVIQIVASIVVLSLSKPNGDADYKLFSWVVGYACGCVLMLPLLYCRYIVRGTVNLQLYGIVEVLKMSLSCFFAVWFVLGNVWVFGSSSTGKDDTKLETLCLVFLASGCIMYAMPVVRCAAFCESGVLAAGTDKERAISGEDAVCCICLGKYADNDEVRELPCSHFFHVECVDKWLKINPRCPLCQSELGGAGGASTLVTHSSQDQSERMTDTAS